MKVISSEKIPIKMWLEDIEDSAMEQAINLANLPFAFKHIAIMPDCHTGYGMPIGGVLAANGVIVPNAVGVDIGCGMCAVKTSLENISIDILKSIMEEIRKRIPLGFDHHEQEQSWDGYNDVPDIKIIHEQLESSKKQLGTLGGGNHFIEIQKGSDGFVWIMIHSGSRNFGYKIAKTYNKIAQDLCILWYSNIPVIKGEDGLAFLPIQTKEAKEYLEAMNFALKFAYANRLKIIEQIQESFLLNIKCDFDSVINIHHNYARFENHFNQNVIVHRKGAVSAKKGEIGIIPGSQGTKSYIVSGLGNVQSFNSSSHGAGRIMGRGQAKRELKLKDEINRMNEKGIIHGMRNIDDLDESSGAYKSIEDVMKNQSDLVEVLVELTPLAVIKG